MNILVGCECSGIVRQAFRALCHNAWSCDLKPAEDASAYHYQADITKVIPLKRWDIIILHPDCTALTVAGNHVYAEGKPKHRERILAAQWTESLWNLAIANSDSVCLENPVGVLPRLTSMGKPSQYIQPYNFGHSASKKTGLHLHNLPPLVPTNRIQGRQCSGVERWDNQTDSGQNKLGPSPTRAADRARTYQGIASAMANQWG